VTGLFGIAFDTFDLDWGILNSFRQTNSIRRKTVPEHNEYLILTAPD